jgi:hypothetical protein
MATPVVWFISDIGIHAPPGSLLFTVGMGGLLHGIASFGVSQELLDREDALAKECEAANEPFKEKKD